MTPAWLLGLQGRPTGQSSQPWGLNQEQKQEPPYCRFKRYLIWKELLIGSSSLEFQWLQLLRNLSVSKTTLPTSQLVVLLLLAVTIADRWGHGGAGAHFAAKRPTWLPASFRVVTPHTITITGMLQKTLLIIFHWYLQNYYYLDPSKTPSTVVQSMYFFQLDYHWKEVGHVGPEIFSE